MSDFLPPRSFSAPLGAPPGVATHARTWWSPADRPHRLLAAAARPTPGTARIFSRADGDALFHRIVAMTTGGGDTTVTLRSTWISFLRWARNRPVSAGTTLDQCVVITRSRRGVSQSTAVDQLDEATLTAAVQQLEQGLATLQADPTALVPEPLGRQTYLTPGLWSDATAQMTPQALSDAARHGVAPVVEAKLVAAGYAEIGATSLAIFNTRGLDAYAAATGALYTETVRLPDGSGSGWAGKSHLDWAKLDVPTLAATALEKCRASAHPVKIEPGRYTAILESKAVALLWWRVMQQMNRQEAEEDGAHIYHLGPPDSGKSKIGVQIFDSRLTITSDPMDPECGYIPFDMEGNPYQKVTWVENGVLKELAYDRKYAREKLRRDAALPNPMAFRISGGDMSIAEMIASTERGIYVTHFGRLELNKPRTLGQVGVTRDGVWLIEQGQLVHPITNLWINDSPMVVFNQVLQVGPSVRNVGIQDVGDGGVIRDLPTQMLNDGNVPVVAPPMKVRDFNFTRLADAV